MKRKHESRAPIVCGPTRSFDLNCATRNKTLGLLFGDAVWVPLVSILEWNDLIFLIASLSVICRPITSTALPLTGEERNYEEKETEEGVLHFHHSGPFLNNFSTRNRCSRITLRPPRCLASLIVKFATGIESHAPGRGIGKSIEPRRRRTARISILWPFQVKPLPNKIPLLHRLPKMRILAELKLRDRQDSDYRKCRDSNAPYGEQVALLLRKPR